MDIKLQKIQRSTGLETNDLVAYSHIFFIKFMRVIMLSSLELLKHMLGCLAEAHVALRRRSYFFTHRKEAKGHN